MRIEGHLIVAYTNRRKFNSSPPHTDDADTHHKYEQCKQGSSTTSTSNYYSKGDSFTACWSSISIRCGLGCGMNTRCGKSASYIIQLGCCNRMCCGIRDSCSKRPRLGCYSRKCSGRTGCYSGTKCFVSDSCVKVTAQ